MSDDRDQLAFEIMYPAIRGIYEQFVNEGFEPTEIFGVMLGIMAQEYRTYSTKADFEEFLMHIASQDWPEVIDEPPPPKGKPNLRVVK